MHLGPGDPNLYVEKFEMAYSGAFLYLGKLWDGPPGPNVDLMRRKDQRDLSFHGIAYAKDQLKKINAK